MHRRRTDILVAISAVIHVEYAENHIDVCADITAIWLRVFLDVLPNCIGIKEPGIVSKEAENEPRQQATRFFGGEMIGVFYRLVELPYRLHRSNVDRVFRHVVLHVLIGEKSELTNVLCEIDKVKFCNSVVAI